MLFRSHTEHGDVQAVRGINYKVNKGETVALVGESGCGKSASVKPIMGEKEANQVIKSGEINFTYQTENGQKTVDLLKISPKEVQSQIKGKEIAMVFQDPMTSLDPTMKIEKQIAEAVKASNSQINKEQLNKRVLELIETVGVVANIATNVNVMYAGKIVETGTTEDIFFDPRHPYTWGLLESVPDVNESVKELPTIAGTIPDLTQPVVGDAFAPRNKYALNIDFKEQPPMFEVNDHHYAATWLLDKRAPKVEIPTVLKRRIEKMKKEAETDGE